MSDASTSVRLCDKPTALSNVKLNPAVCQSKWSMKGIFERVTLTQSCHLSTTFIAKCLFPFLSVLKDQFQNRCFFFFRELINLTHMLDPTRPVTIVLSVSFDTDNVVNFCKKLSVLLLNKLNKFSNKIFYLEQLVFVWFASTYALWCTHTHIRA